jgi:hypothetical protein
LAPYKDFFSSQTFAVDILIPENEDVNVAWSSNSISAPIDSRGLSHSAVYIPEGMSKPMAESSSLETGSLSLPLTIAVMSAPDFAVCMISLQISLFV